MNLPFLTGDGFLGSSSSDELSSELLSLAFLVAWVAVGVAGVATFFGASSSEDELSSELSSELLAFFVLAGCGFDGAEKYSWLIWQRTTAMWKLSSFSATQNLRQINFWR